MRSTPWIFFLLGLAVLGALVGIVVSGSRADPRELIDSALRLSSGPDPNPKAALDELDFALRVAEAEGDDALVGEILSTRGRMHMALGSLVLARADFEHVLARYRPKDAGAELQLALIELGTGDHRAALDRTSRVLEAQPTLADGWTIRGRALVAVLARTLERAEEVCQSALPDEPSERARSLLRRAADLAPSDPRRVSLLKELRELFREDDEHGAREVMQLADEASERALEAREALAQSFRGKPLVEPMLSYLRLLADSGRHQEVIDFAMTAVNFPTVGGSPHFLELMMRSLLADSRPHAAADAVDLYFDRGSLPGLEFYEAWCEALYRSERWKPLVYVGNGMVNAGDPERRSIGQFYIGAAHARLAQHFQAPSPLLRYVGRGVTVEPFPGAGALAWKLLASCYQAQELADEELGALRSALQLAPTALEDAGLAWLRVAELLELQAPEAFAGASTEQEEALTHALQLLPSRLGELMPRWRVLGEKGLAASRTEIPVLARQLDDQGRFAPAGPVAPYELFRLAELHHSEGNWLAVLSVGRMLLDDYPGLVPALDLCIAAAHKMGDVPAEAEYLVARLESAGPDAPTLSKLARLPSDALDLDQRLRVVELDPENTGRLLVAHTLRAEGRDEQAVAGLLAIPREHLADEGRMLAVEMLRELGRPAEAQELLAGIPPGSPWQRQAQPLAFTLAAEAGDRARLAALIREFEQEDEVDAVALVATCDRLFLCGFASEARKLLRDAQSRPEACSGAVLLHLAQAAWLEGNAALADESLQRAEAFETGGGAEIGSVIQAVEQGAWSRLPACVQLARSAALESSASLSPIQAAILDLLAEETVEARRRIAEGTRQEPGEPLWPLLEAALSALTSEPLPQSLAARFAGDAEKETLTSLFGPEGGDRDPRRFLARVLGLFQSEWTAWAVAELERTKVPAPGSLWSSYLAARGRELRGDWRTAEERARGLLAAWPAFAPAWDLLERVQIQRLERSDHPLVMRTRVQRRKALGEFTGNHPEDHLLRARSLVESGELEPALQAARRAVETDENSVLAWLEVARLHARLSEWRPALQAGARACSLATVSSDSPAVAEFLGLLEDACQGPAQKSVRDYVRSQLDPLAERFPDDPLVALALARFDLEGPKRAGTVLGLNRALERLARFRERTAGVAIASLRRRGARPWKDFLDELDPRLAEGFVRGEVRLQPGDTDLWMMLAESCAAQGRRTEAIAIYQRLERTLPSARLCRALAALFAETGRDTELVQKYTHRAAQLEGSTKLDPSLELLFARSLVNFGPQPREQGIEILARLWSGAAKLADRELALEIGRAYGTALCWRSDPRDRKLAHDVLVQVAEGTRDPSRKNLTQALSNLALQLSSRSGS